MTEGVKPANDEGELPTGRFEERFLWMMKNLPTFAEEPELWDDPYFTDFMEQAIETARRMLAMGLGQDVVAQVTGLTEEQIKAL